MATCRQRGRRFEFIVKRKGLLPKPIYLYFDEKKEGLKYCCQLEKLLDQGVVPEEFIRKSEGKLEGIAELIDEYRKLVSIKQNDKDLIKRIYEKIGEVKLTDVDFDWAECWVRDMKRVRNLAPGTIRHNVGALARCLDWGVRKGYLAVNPLRTLPRGYAQYTAQDKKYVAGKDDQERDRRLEPGEEEMIRRVLTTEYKPEGKQRPMELEHRQALSLMFDLALETAMRMREIYTLNRKQINIHKQTIFLEKTKNGDRRQVPLSTVAVKTLRCYLKEVPKGERGRGELIFPFWNGIRNSEELASVTSKLSRLWKRVFDHAGCDGIGFHDLRHEATSRFYERTSLSDLQIARITGHKNLAILKRYANLRASDLAGKLW